MPITPLAALAVPAAGIAAMKLAQRIGDNRPFASLLANVRGEQPDVPADDPAGKAAREVEKFAALVQERLTAAGIRTSIRFELTSDADGKLRVVGEHPKKQRIEQALAGDDELATAFAQLAAGHHLGQAPQRHAEFAEQYVHGRAPAGIVPSTTMSSRFSVVINGDEVSTAAAVLA